MSSLERLQWIKDAKQPASLNMISDLNLKEEKKLNELLRLREKRDEEELEAAMAAEVPLGEERVEVEWDVALELLPEYAAVEALSLERPELEALEEAREIEVTRSTVLRAVGGAASESALARARGRCPRLIMSPAPSSRAGRLHRCRHCRRRCRSPLALSFQSSSARSSRPTRAAST